MSSVLSHWQFDPIVVVVAFIVVAHEVGLSRLKARSNPSRTKRRRWRSIALYCGLALLLISVMSPIDFWSDNYFYVHMLQHIILAFYVPMLLVAGAPWLPLAFAIPVATRRRLGRAVLLGSWASSLRWCGRVLLNPWTALIAFNAVMVLWHVPSLFDLSQRNQAVHIWIVHGSFLAAGVLFWLQIIPSHPIRPKASAMWQIGAIISTNIVMFVLAMSMSLFSKSSWYAVYAHVPGVTLSPFADQQIGAAILWVCGDFWAVPALVIVIKRAIDQEGGLADAVDRLFHRGPQPTLGELGPPG